jgi:hypothetical protein
MLDWHTEVAWRRRVRASQLRRGAREEAARAAGVIGLAQRAAGTRTDMDGRVRLTAAR